jgi:hypothetical protein
MRFGRLVERSNELTAELLVNRASGQLVLRKRVNLLASRGVVLQEIIDDLKEENLGLDVDWKRVLRDSFEEVIEAQRNGVVIERVGGRLHLPPGIQWLCEGLVIRNKINCWLGAGGTGKSTLAKALCLYHALGRDFLGRRTEQGMSVYLDWEDDRAGYERALHLIGASLGVEEVPETLYVSVRGRRLRDMVEWLSKAVTEDKVSLIVLDPLAPAGGSAGEHRNFEDVALEIETVLGQLPPVTVLALDHITSAEHRASAGGQQYVPLKARGSERKVEFIRNQWTLMLDRSEMEYGRHVISWHHTKANDVRLLPGFAVELVHSETELSIEGRSLKASPQAVESMSKSKQYLIWLEDHPGSTIENIAIGNDGKSTKQHLDAVRSAMMRHADRKTAYQVDGKWYAGNPDDLQETQAAVPF